MLEPIGTGPATGTSPLQTPPAAPARACWHDLSTDLLLHIVGHLDTSSLCALAAAQRHNHATLASVVRSARIGWRIGGASSLSAVHCVLRDIDDGVLPPGARAMHLAALAERLPLLHPVLGAGAVDAMLDAVATLPPAVRQPALGRLLAGIGWIAHQRVKPHLFDRSALHTRLRSCQARLLEPTLQLPAAQRAQPLQCYLDGAPWLPFSVNELPRWIDLALGLPAADRAATLAALFTALRWHAGTPAVDLAGALQTAYRKLVMPDGNPDVATRTVLLCAAAAEVGGARPDRADEVRAAQVRGWLLDEARRLPGANLLTVLARVAEWPSYASHAYGSDASRRLWEIGDQAGADVLARATWAESMRFAVPQMSAVWARLWDEAQHLAAGARAEAIARLASCIGALPDFAERGERWSLLFGETVLALPVSLRARPLRALADALLELAGTLPDPRWEALVDAAAGLAPAHQVAVLFSCCSQSPQLENHWYRYAGLLAQLPDDALEEEMLRAAKSLRVLSAPTAAAVWRSVVALLPRVPAHLREQPWLMLWQMSGISLGPQEAAAAWTALLQTLAHETPAIQEAWLAAAAAMDHAEASGLLLARTAELPVARRAAVLAVLARGMMIRRREDVLEFWEALAGAVRALPAVHRGTPLHAMVEMEHSLAGIFDEPRADALRELCEGVPAPDLPPGFGPVGNRL